MNIIQELKNIKKEFQKLEGQLQDPSVISNTKKLKQASQEYNRLKIIMELAEAYEKAVVEQNGAKETLEGAEGELRELAESEIARLDAELVVLHGRLASALVPPDPLDSHDAIVEIRAGTGGDEAALFAADLYRMYSRFAERHKWKVELLRSSQSDLGGFKEIDFGIKGSNAYGELKYEGGVHRVQRIPETEKQGRVHTSTATVVVLPEIEEEEFKIDPKDLKIEATTSSGHGGQSVNTTYSAIRLTHVPTGIMVSCQDERSQQQNKARAMQIIRSRVFDFEQQKQQAALKEKRRGQIGTADRSEKIRTYNYPQDRITDHRAKKNYSNIPSIMDGGIGTLIADVKAAVMEQA